MNRVAAEFARSRNGSVPPGTGIEPTYAMPWEFPVLSFHTFCRIVPSPSKVVGVVQLRGHWWNRRPGIATTKLRAVEIGTEIVVGLLGIPDPRGSPRGSFAAPPAGSGSRPRASAGALQDASAAAVTTRAAGR